MKETRQKSVASFLLLCPHYWEIYYVYCLAYMCVYGNTHTHTYTNSATLGHRYTVHLHFALSAQAFLFLFFFCFSANSDFLARFFGSLPLSFFSFFGLLRHCCVCILNYTFSFTLRIPDTNCYDTYFPPFLYFSLSLSRPSSSSPWIVLIPYSFSPQSLRDFYSNSFRLRSHLTIFRKFFL